MVVRGPFGVDLLAKRSRLDRDGAGVGYEGLGWGSHGVVGRSKAAHRPVSVVVFSCLDQILSRTILLSLLLWSHCLVPQLVARFRFVGDFMGLDLVCCVF